MASRLYDQFADRLELEQLVERETQRGTLEIYLRPPYYAGDTYGLTYFLAGKHVGGALPEPLNKAQGTYTHTLHAGKFALGLTADEAARIAARRAELNAPIEAAAAAKHEAWERRIAAAMPTIITESHIDAKHAASQYFPRARSADGRFHWQSLNATYTFLANGEEIFGKWDEEERFDAELLAEARAFSAACCRLKEQRREAEERADTPAFLASVEARGPIPHFPYRSSEEAWAAEDEATWAEMRRHGL